MSVLCSLHQKQIYHKLILHQRKQSALIQVIQVIQVVNVFFLFVVMTHKEGHWSKTAKCKAASNSWFNVLVDWQKIGPINSLNKTSEMRIFAGFHSFLW